MPSAKREGAVKYRTDFSHSLIERAAEKENVLKEKLVRAAMRLDKLWRSMAPLRPDGSLMEPHWYPLSSEKEAKALCRVCARLVRSRKGARR